MRSRCVSDGIPLSVLGLHCLGPAPGYRPQASCGMVSEMHGDVLDMQVSYMLLYSTASTLAYCNWLQVASAARTTCIRMHRIYLRTALLRAHASAYIGHRRRQLLASVYLFSR